MTPYPLLFEPMFKPTVWGGRTLESLGKTLPPDQQIGESWEVADVPGLGPPGRSIIRNGELKGTTLHDAIATHRSMILGHARPLITSTDGECFPLLIKLLDARENLSLQVHPSDGYVAAHPGALPKAEAWVVLQAAPGAVIYRGLRDGLDASLLREHLRENRVIDDLIALPVRAGDCIHLPSGTVHALGAGIVVAEAQTPGDTTFRLHDWNRSGRTMHIEQAMQCIDFAHPAQRQPGPRPRTPWRVGGLTTTELLAVDEFTIERLDATESIELPIITSGLPMIWMVIAGSASIQTVDDARTDLRLGMTSVLPAGMEDAQARLVAETSILKITPPSPTRGMIA